jgi:hypothetical protein
MAVIHAVAAVAISVVYGVLGQGLSTKLFCEVASYESEGIDFESFPCGSMQLVPFLIAFFAVTSVAHVIYATNPNNFYTEMINDGSNWARWIEYAISATLMIIVVAILSGIRNPNLLSLIALGNFVVMMQGYSIERALQQNYRESGYSPNAKNIIVPMLTSWVLFAGIWGVILISFGKRVEEARKSGVEVPLWIWFVQIPLLLFFASFGIVNLIQTFTKKPYSEFEIAYVTLSLVAKLFLGVWIVIGIFQTNELSSNTSNENVL